MGQVDPSKCREKEGRRRATVRRCVPLGILAIGFAAFFAFGLQKYLSFEMLQENRVALRAMVEANRFLALAVYVLVYALAVGFSLPGGAILTIAGGFLFGPVLATLAVVVGATAGATGLFLAARTALGDMLRARAGSAINRMAEGFRRNALSYLLFLRLVPAFPFWLVNLVPAFLGVSLRTFVVGTFFGIIPGTVVYALVGNGLGTVLDAGERPDLDVIFRWEILLPVLGLGVLALSPVLYKRWKARRC